MAVSKIRWLSQRAPAWPLRFLDFGCGDGLTAEYFFNYFPGCDYHGVDVSAESLAVARKHAPAAAKFSASSGGNLPYDDNTFDHCLASCVFHHIERDHHVHLLREIIRVLRPGGTFTFWEHNPHNPLTRWIVSRCPFDEGCVLLKPRYASDAMKLAGLESIQTEFVLFMPRSRWFSPLLSLEMWLRRVPVGAQYIAFGTKPRPGPKCHHQQPG